MGAFLHALQCPWVHFFMIYFRKDVRNHSTFNPSGCVAITMPMPQRINIMTAYLTPPLHEVTRMHWKHQLHIIHVVNSWIWSELAYKVLPLYQKWTACECTHLLSLPSSPSFEAFVHSNPYFWVPSVWGGCTWEAIACQTKTFHPCVSYSKASLLEKHWMTQYENKYYIKFWE